MTYLSLLQLGFTAYVPSPAEEEGSAPDFANVVLLTAFDSGAGGVVDDESNSNHTITLVDAIIDTAAKKFGTGSLLITVGTERCTIADSADWHFGAGAFTIEGWFSWSGFLASQQYMLMNQSVTSGNQRTWSLSWSAANELLLSCSSNGLSSGAKATSAPLPDRVNGQWYHIAADFDGSTYRIYLDGVMVASGGSPITLFDGTGVLRIGGIPPTSSGASFIGNIDEVRITKGEAVYASDSGFTSPTEPFPRS